jgi:hypothetical protein
MNVRFTSTAAGSFAQIAVIHRRPGERGKIGFHTATVLSSGHSRIATPPGDRSLNACLSPALSLLFAFTSTTAPAQKEWNPQCSPRFAVMSIIDGEQALAPDHLSDLEDCLASRSRR